MGAYLTAPSRQAGGAATATWAVAAKMAKTVASLANMMPECVGVVLEVEGESVLSVWDGGVTEVVARAGVVRVSRFSGGKEASVE